ncbi:hypothetical protein [Tunturiibacter gelidoferens]|uniref:Coiled-coil protein SlyX n=1 Tax=Tunturiibacter gelidiferens TaxID=3069689 RepID=A0A9X0U6H6_9BACT|nr:hypothetical protein [Edaphobacter lichenicola]MBB5329812.1 putative coiled-coil protein SlyX [Edaphobacter lichenicola]
MDATSENPVKRDDGVALELTIEDAIQRLAEQLVAMEIKTQQQEAEIEQLKNVQHAQGEMLQAMDLKIKLLTSKPARTYDA